MDFSQYIIPLISVIVGFILYKTYDFFIARKGNRVVLQEGNKTTLIEPSYELSENLSITYKGKEITKLYLSEFALFNDGNKDITNFETVIKITPRGYKQIIEYKLIDKDNKLEESCSDEEYPSILIKRPYLNKRKANKQEVIQLQVFSDYDFGISISGGGEGWNSVYKVKKGKFTDSLAFYIAGVSLMMLIAYLIADLLRINQIPSAVLAIFLFLSGGFMIYRMKV